jgi:UDP-glucose 4-epimerase
MYQKKILITGAEGFIAVNLAIFLSKKNFKIFGIGNKKYTKKISNKFGYNLLLNKKIDLKNLKKNFKNVDLIIHCAGSGSVGLSNQENYKKNYLTTKAVLDFSIQLKKKPKIIFMSSYSLYGNSYNNSIKENFTLRPLSSYAMTKKFSEEILLKYSKIYNLNISILRLASIYGEGLKKQLMFDACEKISNNKNVFYGTGNEIRDWLHISDLTILVYKIIKKNLNYNTIINCGTGKGNKVKNILEIIKKQFNTNIKIKYISKKKASPKILITNIKIAKSYKWEPKINIKKGILNYVKWYKKINA